MNSKEKQELLEKIRNKKNSAIPTAIIQLIIGIPLEILLFTSINLTGIVDTELQKVFLYTLMGCITSLTTEKIISSAKQKYIDYEDVAINNFLIDTKIKKVNQNIIKLTTQEKIKLLSMIRDNPNMIELVSELEKLKEAGEEEFYNSILQVLNDTEKNNQKQSPITPKKVNDNENRISNKHRRKRTR